MLVTNFQIEKVTEIVKEANRKFTKRFIIHMTEEETNLTEKEKKDFRGGIRRLFNGILHSEDHDLMIENSIIQTARKFNLSNEDDLFVGMYSICNQVSLAYMEIFIRKLTMFIGSGPNFVDYLVSHMYSYHLDPDHRWGKEMEEFISNRSRTSIEDEMYQDLENGFLNEDH